MHAVSSGILSCELIHIRDVFSELYILSVKVSVKVNSQAKSKTWTELQD